MSNLSNKERVLKVATALEELNDKIVYVGGAVVQFYASDRGASNPMSTYDVDCVVDLTTYKEYRAFEKELHSKHFNNDTSENAPICRYLFEDEVVDFMPKVDTEIGASNRWYFTGVKHKLAFPLSPKTTIFIMPVCYYLASKFEALASRGGIDYRGAKDFEDIVFVVNSSHSLKEELEIIDDEEVKRFVKQEFSTLYGRPNLREEVECALNEDDRTDHVLKVMKSMF